MGDFAQITGTAIIKAYHELFGQCWFNFSGNIIIYMIFIVYFEIRTIYCNIAGKGEKFGSQILAVSVGIEFNIGKGFADFHSHLFEFFDIFKVFKVPTFI